VIELARLLEPCDKQGHPRTTGQVKWEVKQFLERLELEAAEQPDEADVIACIVKAVRNRWWAYSLASVSRMSPPPTMIWKRFSKT